jgi:type IV pilus assembly protein PilY1
VLGDFNVSSGTGQPSPAVKLQDGRFAVVFGNGTGSTTGNAALFILPVQGPSISGATANWSGRYHRIDLPGSPGNGLSTPTLLDTNNDGMADTVYAGDVQGNLWKIDISSNNPALWGSAYKSGAGAALPLFIATDGTTNLPITGAPQFSFPAFGGTLVTFATGKSVVTSDFPRTDRTNRVFTIWDRPAFASGGRQLPRIANNTLVVRTLTRLASGQVTVAPGAAIDYLNPIAASAKDGWYFNLPSSSEMVVSNLEYRARNVFFTSIRPPVSTACEKQPEATLYALNPETGLPDNAALGTVETTVNGVTSAVPLIGVPVEDQRLRIVNDASNRTTTTTVTTGGTTTTTTTPVCPDGSASLRLVGAKADRSLCFSQANSRFQWREIPGLRTK